MIVTRRGFLQSCLALGAAPAIVRADSLMRVIPRESTFFYEDLFYCENFAYQRFTSQGNFQEIMEKVLRENHEKIAASISTRNAMFDQIVERK